MSAGVHAVTAQISVCVATFHRRDRLEALLADLSRQTVAPYEVVIVDNDAAGSARAVAERWSDGGASPMPWPLRYEIEPQQNISLARNRCVALARGSWIAFVDDDERVPSRWLAQLAQAAHALGADGVLGPVLPRVPAQAPTWIRRGRFYDWPRMPTGTVVPLNRLRFGNVLLRASLLRTSTPPFDPRYGLTGGEDGDLLARLAHRGARIVWCDEAHVIEPVESTRLSLRWLMRRSLRGGQDFARHALAGRYGASTPARRALLVGRAALQLVLAAALAVLCLPLGRHRAVHWLTRASANFGKLSVLWGWHYREYA